MRIICYQEQQILFLLKPVAFIDITLEIKRMKPNKAPSHDLIGSKVIKCPGIFTYKMAKI